MNSDFKELLKSLNDQGVEYLIVGGYAVAFHARPRFTQDLDIWVRPSAKNAALLIQAFLDFGLPLVDIEESDFAKEGTQYMIGVPPVAFDFLTTVPGIEFDACWERRVQDEIEGVNVSFVAKTDLITAKETSGRDIDRSDLRNLTESAEEE
ncbi:MAG: nucleotidyltransferase [Verrucomicrobiota bacterium]